MSTQTRKRPAKTSADLPVLTREQVFENDDRTTKTVPMSSWGGSVVIRKLSAAEYDDAQTAAVVNGEFDNTLGMVHMIIQGCVEPKFTVDDVPLLLERGVDAIITLSGEISRLSGIDRLALEELERRFLDAA